MKVKEFTIGSNRKIRLAAYEMEDISYSVTFCDLEEVQNLPQLLENIKGEVIEFLDNWEEEVRNKAEPP